MSRRLTVTRRALPCVSGFPQDGGGPGQLRWRGAGGWTSGGTTVPELEGRGPRRAEYTLMSASEGSSGEAAASPRAQVTRSRGWTPGIPTQCLCLSRTVFRQLPGSSHPFISGAPWRESSEQRHTKTRVTCPSISTFSASDSLHEMRKGPLRS